MSRKFAALLLIPALGLLSPVAMADHGQGDRGPEQDHQQSHQQYHGSQGGDQWQGGWHGKPYYSHGQPYWRLDIHAFPSQGYSVWRGGHWYHGWYGPRLGWWWIVGSAWYYYPAPMYPYPNPYVPGTVLYVNPQPAAPPPPAQAPVQYWYHCSAPEGYYPYVPDCPGGWTPVPAVPPAPHSP